jgi:hypothetical protein
MFAPAYMAENDLFQMLSLHVRRFLLVAAVFFLQGSSVGRGCAPPFRPVDYSDGNPQDS